MKFHKYINNAQAYPSTLGATYLQPLLEACCFSPGQAKMPSLQRRLKDVLCYQACSVDTVPGSVHSEMNAAMHDHVLHLCTPAWEAGSAHTRALSNVRTHNAIALKHTQNEWCRTWRQEVPAILIINQRDAPISQIYFWNRTLHVSDSFSVRHQESITVYTAIGMSHTGYAGYLLAGSRVPAWSH